MTACLAETCPTCGARAGNACRIPSRRHPRAPHPARWRAHYAKIPAIRAAIDEYDVRHDHRAIVVRLLEQQEGV